MPVEKEQENGKKGRPSVIDHEKLITLYSEGKTDLEIAQAMGVSRRTIGMARKRYDIKANRQKGRPLTKDKKEAKEITPQTRSTVLRLLSLGYSPGEIALRNKITRNKVIEIHMQSKQRTWPELVDELSQTQQLQFKNWLNDVNDVIDKKIPLMESELTKERIKGIREEIDRLPPEKRGMLPTPKVMSKMGVKDAYLVALSLDAECVGYRQLINLLQDIVEKRYWERIRQGLAEMDHETCMVAEKYLNEEVYKPFYAGSFTGLLQAK